MFSSPKTHAPHPDGGARVAHTRFPPVVSGLCSGGVGSLGANDGSGSKTVHARERSAARRASTDKAPLIIFSVDVFWVNCLRLVRHRERAARRQPADGELGCSSGAPGES